jgi:excisionase family DNA binding protein
VAKIYTVKETAERLGVAAKTVNHWLSQNIFPNAYKLNPDGLTSPYRIPEEDIEAFEAKRHRRTPAE